MKKSILHKFLVLAVVFSIVFQVTGCGNSGEENAKGEEKQEMQEENGSNVEEDITLSFLSWESDLDANNQAVIEAFENENPGIKVEMEYVTNQDANEYLKKVDILLMSGEKADIVMQPSYPLHSERAVQENVLAPLDSFLEEEGIEYDDIYELPVRVNGTLYSLPADTKPWFVMLNKDHLDEAGLDVPPLDWTWDDYREYAKVLTQGEGQSKRFGSYMHSFSVVYYLGLLSEKEDNAFYKEDGSLDFDNPLYKEWLEYRFALENEDESQVPFVDVKSQNLNYRSLFFNENVSMMPMGSWMISEVNDVDKFPHDFKTAFAPLPRLHESTDPGMTLTQAHYYCIPQNSEHKEAAYKFIRFYTTEGVKIKGTALTAERDVDKIPVLEKIIGDNADELYDTESLFNVFNNPNWKNNVFTIVPSYNAQINDLYKEEVEKYLIGGATVDEVLNNVMERGQDIIESN